MNSSERLTLSLSYLGDSLRKDKKGKKGKGNKEEEGVYEGPKNKRKCVCVVNEGVGRRHREVHKQTERRRERELW